MPWTDSTTVSLGFWTLTLATDSPSILVVLLGLIAATNSSSCCCRNTHIFVFFCRRSAVPLACYSALERSSQHSWSALTSTGFIRFCVAAASSGVKPTTPGNSSHARSDVLVQSAHRSRKAHGGAPSPAVVTTATLGSAQTSLTQLLYHSQLNATTISGLLKVATKMKSWARTRSTSRRGVGPHTFGAFRVLWVVRTPGLSTRNPGFKASFGNYRVGENTVR